jgi:hypothetical protein
MWSMMVRATARFSLVLYSVQYLSSLTLFTKARNRSLPGWCATLTPLPDSTSWSVACAMIVIVCEGDVVTVPAVAVVAVEAEDGGRRRAEGGLGAVTAGDGNGEDLLLAKRLGAGDDAGKRGEWEEEAAACCGGEAAT